MALRRQNAVTVQRFAALVIMGRTSSD